MSGHNSLAARFSIFSGSLIGFFAVAAIAGVLVSIVCLPLVLVAKVGTTAAQSALQPSANAFDTLVPMSQKTTIFAKSGGKNVPLASFYTQDRDVIKWQDLPKTVINALLAAEDIRYYQHGGVDPQALLRAVTTSNSANGSGGSTIAMQYVKNACVQQAELLPTDKQVQAAYHSCVDRSYARKLSDIRNAIALEKRYSKNDILLAYLNIIGFGGRVYGIEAAAQYYYGVHTKDLTPAQAASLIATVNDPGTLRIDQQGNLAANKVRRDYILHTEYTHKLLSEADYTKAINTKVTPHIHQPSSGCMSAGVAGSFCDYVVNEIENNPTFGDSAGQRYLNLTTGGWQIYTTLNLDLQKSAQATMHTYVPATNPYFNIGGAAVSVEVGTGRILAMTQNRSYNNTGQAEHGQTSVNYAAGYNSTGFQPGSTYKVFTLLDWLKTGHSIYDTVNGDARPLAQSNFTKCGQPDNDGTWTFGNDDPGEGGYQSVLQGTAGSVNGVFASMATQLDLCDIRATAESFGVQSSDGTPLQANPPSVIGGASAIAPLDMTAAYAGVANNGVYCAPIAIDKITTLDGKSVAVPPQHCTRAVSTTVAKNAKTALHAVIKGGTAAGDAPDGDYYIAKTGTTDSAVQTWEIGSNSKVTTGVWVGNVSGYANLRGIGGLPYCNRYGTSAATERHCVWTNIEGAANRYTR